MCKIIATGGGSSESSGASTTVSVNSPVGLLTDDLLVQCVGSGEDTGTGATISTPSGWTLHNTTQFSEIRGYIFYRRATADGETFPDITLDSSLEWSTTFVVLRGVDYTSGPIGDSDQSSSGSADQGPPDLTTDGANSTLLYFQLKERRAMEGVIQGSGRVNQALLETFLVGTTEGDDTGCSLASDFEATASTVVDSPTFDNNGGSSDSISWALEIRGDGSLIPLYLTSSATTPLSTSDYSVVSVDTWRDVMTDSGVVLDESSQSTWSFDAATDVDPSNEQITLTAHGIANGRVVRADANGNTLPTGITDGAYYYVAVVDANTVTLRDADIEHSADSDWFEDTGTPKATINITADGSGTCRFIDAGLIWDDMVSSATNFGTLDTPPDDHIAGAVNFYGSGVQWGSDRDMTGETVAFIVTTIPPNRSDLPSTAQIVMIDSAGDWRSWLVGNSVNSLSGELVLIEPSNQSFFKEAGTFDITSVRYIIYLVKAKSGDWGSASQAMVADFLVDTPTFAGGASGAPGTWLDVYSILQTFSTQTSFNPSALQYVFFHPLTMGDGHLVTDADLFFSDDAKSVAFPPSADGINTLQYYIGSLGVSFDLNAASSFSYENAQLGGATGAFDVTVDTDLPSAATFSLDGTALVNGDVTLDAEVALDRALFVNGGEVIHDDAEIRNSTFVDVNTGGSSISATTSFDVQDSTFQLSSDEDIGHGIELTATGTYSFVGLLFSGYGPALVEFDTTSDVDAGTDVVTATAHGYTTGDAVYYQDQGGSASMGLTDGTLYYVRAVSVNTLGFYTTKALAVADTSRIALTSTGGETHELASAKAAIYNSSGGSVTINISGGGDTPTVRNSDGSDTTVANTVTVSVTALNSASAAIENARVLLEADSGGDLPVGTDILSALTNASGIVEDTGFNFTSDQPVTGRVRKGSASPLYKTAPLTGTITSAGLSLTVFMVDDE